MTMTVEMLKSAKEKLMAQPTPEDMIYYLSPVDYADLCRAYGVEPSEDAFANVKPWPSLAEHMLETTGYEPLPRDVPQKLRRRGQKGH